MGVALLVTAGLRYGSQILWQTFYDKEGMRNTKKTIKGNSFEILRLFLSDLSPYNALLS